jgi:hypothetical protein
MSAATRSILELAPTDVYVSTSTEPAGNVLVGRHIAFSAFQADKPIGRDVVALIAFLMDPGVDWQRGFRLTSGQFRTKGPIDPCHAPEHDFSHWPGLMSMPLWRRRHPASACQFCPSSSCMFPS